MLRICTQHALQSLGPVNVTHTHIIIESEGLLQVADTPTAPNQHRKIALQRLQALFLQHLPLKQIQGLHQLDKKSI